MQSRYQNIKTTKLNLTGSLYYQTNVYPEVQPTNNDYYVITTVDDRLDLLAFDFYQDSSLWWIIASANNSEQGSLQVEPGVQLRVPYDKLVAVNLYRQANQRR